MKENSLTLCLLDMKLCRLTQEIYQTDARRTKTTHTVSATRSMSLPSQQQTYEICTVLSCFSQKMYGQKVLNILPFCFFCSFFSRFFNNSVRVFLYYSVKKESVILRSLSCFNPYFLLQKCKNKNIAKKQKQWFIKQIVS